MITKLPVVVPAIPNSHTRNWRGEVPKQVEEALDALSATLKTAMDATEEQSVGDNDDFHSVWIGLLLGSGACDDYDAAHRWATFVRYHTSDLVA